MSGTRIPEDKLSIYLNDHLAVASGARALADRTVEGSKNDELVAVASYATNDLTDGINQLRRIMDQASVGENKPKRFAALVSEWLGRLKLNGSLRSRSPLSDYTEAEGLASALTYHASVWPTLTRHGLATEAEAADRATRLETRSKELVTALAPLADR